MTVKKTEHVEFDRCPVDDDRPLFAVLAGSEDHVALGRADLIDKFVRDMLWQQMVHHNDKEEWFLGYDDFILLHFLMEMSHALRKAAGAVA